MIMSLKVLNIHGYHGDAENSLYHAFKANSIDIGGPAIDYDSIDPLKLFDLLCREFEDGGYTAVCGTSFGGFFAMAVSAKYSVPVLLINPASVPGVILPQLGYSREQGVRELCSIEYTYFKDLDLSLVSTVIGLDDEVIAPEFRAFTKALLKNERFYEIEGGKHSGYTLPLEDVIRNLKTWFETGR